MFKQSKEKNEIAVKKNFITEIDESKENTFDNLYAIFSKKYNFDKIEIDWTKVFIKKKRKAIIFGGKIPERNENENTSKKDYINYNYTSKIKINTGIINSSYDKFLETLPDGDFYSLRDESVEGRKLIFQNLLITIHLDDYIDKNVKGKQKELLNEFLLRSEQDLLKKKYMESIGFELSESSSTRLHTYVIGDEEALKFYKSNIEAFKEPLSVTTSHIRVKEQKLADKIRAELLENPNKFKEYAKKYSIAEDASEGGFLGTIVKEKDVKLPLYKEFGFTLTKKDQLSVAFKTPKGIEILQLHNRTTKTLDFKKSHTRKLISEMMQPMKRKEKLDRTIKQLRESAKIIIQ